MTCALDRRQQSSESIGIEEISSWLCRLEVLLLKSKRTFDELAGMIPSLFDKKPHFGEFEINGRRSSYGHGFDSPACAIDAGRDVDSENGKARVIDAVYSECQ